MAHYATELFVQCIYSLDLSYDDLIAKESSLKVSLNQIFEDNRGEFINFEEMGDTMRAQCVFPEYTENLFHTLCDSVAPYMDGSVEARLLFVCKDLDFLHIYTISNQKWQECAVHLPPAGPITDVLREQDPPAATTL